MRLYSDLERAYYEELRDIYSQQNIPDFSREVIFLEDAGYYCIYKDEFDAYQKMKAWVLSEGGWVQTEYSVYDPDDVTFIATKEKMKIEIEDLRKDGYFYDFVKFPLIPE